MQSPSEDDLFNSGIAALQAGNHKEARATFRQAIDAGIATGKSWMGMTLACIQDSDLLAADVAADQLLIHEPSNIRGHIIKGDILYGRGEAQRAAGYYGQALKLGEQYRSQLLPPLVADLKRIAERQQGLANAFAQHLLNALNKAGYHRPAASDRFNLALDMLLGKEQRAVDTQPFPQRPLVFYMPDMPYHTFFPEEALAWMKDVQAATDTIEAELEALLNANAEAFTPYIHAGLERPEATDTRLLDSTDWTSAYLWKDGAANPDVQALCPETLALINSLPLTRISGLSPSVLFSKLDSGASIDPHTGLINTRLICHLPLRVPEGCGLRVGADTRETRRGVGWAFDDSIQHEAWNHSDASRIILLFDVWRPELSDDERHLITALLESVTEFRNPTAA